MHWALLVTVLGSCKSRINRDYFLPFVCCLANCCFSCQFHLSLPIGVGCAQLLLRFAAPSELRSGSAGLVTRSLMELRAGMANTGNLQ